ncbi:CLUMA_CG017378, isoform A [Clunio marinus]|uniref:CLUMA_CG017378, isoform A n=1 Tax=Clunio marinus TaxID=568069 RepID=A0A1J1IVZ9_9DIPT|nr:CLUMA_CG017378, isoform A [Clunio marinus]
MFVVSPLDTFQGQKKSAIRALGFSISTLTLSFLKKNFGENLSCCREDMKSLDERLKTAMRNYGNLSHSHCRPYRLNEFISRH